MKKKLSLSIQILIGLILGVVVGIALQSNANIATDFIKPFGTLFLNLIKLIIVPLVFASLVGGVYGLGDIKKLGRIGGKTMVFYMVTTAFAVSLGLLVASIIKVGANFTLPVEELVAEVKETPSIVDVLLNVVPTNPIKAMADGEMLQIITFSIILGSGLLVIGEKGKNLAGIIDSLAETMYAITAAIMKLAPYGVFALITPVVAVNGPQVLFPLIKVIAAAYIASIMHMAIIYSASAATFGKISPIRFFKAMFPAMAVAFTTASSSGTLPVNMKCVEEELGVKKEVASFVLPLGATINMDGTAIYLGVCTLFIAQVYGIPMSFNAMLTVVLTATLASIGTAGVPGAGLIMLTLVLTSVGLPLEGIALIAGIDRILDMMRTTVNITGDACCAVVVGRGEGGIDDVKEKTAA
ncbi:MAG: dicarboxylate/amino acid:cation symporter [Tissierellia bacterium]|nr:dicarboxylate/amino acid:cation symporter [Tissierellia bacterium]